MRTTIRMNEELARRARQMARETDRSFTQLVEEAVSEFIAKPRSGRPRRKITFPVVGDPRRRITDQQYRAAIEEMYNEEAEKIARVSHVPARR